MCTMQPTLFWLDPGQARAPTPGGTTQLVANVTLVGSSPMVDKFVVKFVWTLPLLAGQFDNAPPLQVELLTLAHRVASRATFETK